MATLVWDEVGERIYQTGLDRGVLYLEDDASAPWNGLISVEESPNVEIKPYYLNGVKYLEIFTPGDFRGKLKAFTYPDEFESLNGLAQPAEGLSFHEQPPKSFSLCYRTKIGNDLDGLDHGYKIHVLYNITASPEDYGFETIRDSEIQPIEFVWNLTGIPTKFQLIRPMVHISIDSTKTDPDILTELEDTLYGTESDAPRLPSLLQVAALFGYLGVLTIIDHGDGTWSAIDISDEYDTAYITMIDDTTFQIDNADATYLDADTYEISTTDGGWE